MSNTNSSLLKSHKHKHSRGYLLNNYSYIYNNNNKIKEGMNLRVGHGSIWKEERKRGNSVNIS